MGSPEEIIEKIGEQQQQTKQKAGKGAKHEIDLGSLPNPRRYGGDGKVSSMSWEGSGGKNTNKLQD